MKRTIHIAAAFAALIFCGACARTENFEPEGVKGVPVYGDPDISAKGEILVKFSPEVSEILDKAGVTKAGASGPATRSGVPTFDEVLDIVGGYEIERVFPVDIRNEERTRQNGLHLWYVVRFDASEDVREVADRLSSISELTTIQYCSVLKKNFAKPVPAEPLLNAAAPAAEDAPFNDPGLERQWHYINKGYFDTNANGQQDPEDEVLTGLEGKSTMVAGADINAKEAWKTCTGDPEIIVAVMDEGVMWSHPDLEPNMWVNEGEELSGNEDADGNGYKNDKYGFNFVRNIGAITWDRTEDTGHGTHIAGTIAAVNNNGEGVCGIAGGDYAKGEKGVKIMTLQIFDGSNGSSILNEARAVKYAADNGAVILQCSWGYTSALASPVDYPNRGPRTDEEYEEYSPIEVEAFDYFIHNAGSEDGVMDGGVVIFASGNEFAGMSAYPAAYPPYISVAAIGADFTPSTYSNYGPDVDICAPGGDMDYHQNTLGGIYSTLPPHVSNGTGYGYMEGTSMSCPHVSGIAALGLSYAAKKHLHFNSREYKEMILEAVNPIDDKYSDPRDGRPLYKMYYKNYMLLGPSVINKMTLTDYQYKVGKGYADAARLFSIIDGSEYVKDMTLSNVTIQAGDTEIFNIARCFDEGETAGAVFSVNLSGDGVASAEITGDNRLKVSGIAPGMVKYAVTCNGKTQEAFIIVRKNANNNGII